MKITFPEFISSWNRFLTVTVIMIATGILGTDSMVSADNTSKQRSNVLNQKIILQHSIDATVGVRVAIMSVAVLSTVPINIEYLYRANNGAHDVNNIPVHPISAGSYTLRTMLEAIQHNYPRIQWFVVGHGIFVRYKETDDLKDPLDLRLSTKVMLTLSISGWSDWLYQLHPSTGFACEIPHNNALIHLDLSPDLTIRDVFEKIAEQAEGHWVFNIAPNNTIVSVDMKNGSDSSGSPVTDSKSTKVEATPTAAADQWGRAQIHFFPRFLGSSAL